MKKFNAFTLAEVMVTLMIIGVIASLTMPVLLADSKKKENYVALVKAYSTLANATEIIKTEKGNPRFWNWTQEGIIKDYMDKLQVLCQGENCIPENYDKGVASRGNDFQFVTLDGIYWGIKVSNSGNQRAIFYIDGNGAKGPNEPCKDVFAFILRTDGVIPETNATGFNGCTAASIKKQEISEGYEIKPVDFDGKIDTLDPEGPVSKKRHY